MGLFSSGNKWKRRAQVALEKAQAIEDYQRDVEFQRGLLSNIRQQRIAQAQLSLMNYSDSFTSSSAAGASANIDSALAGEMDYSYGTSQRAPDIQNYQQTAQQYMEKYAKQQKKKAGAFAVAGAVLGAVTGGIGFAAGLSGTLAGATIGQCLGQIASNTGQTETGINNVISGIGSVYADYKTDKYHKRILDTLGKMSPQYELTSIDPRTGQPITGSTVRASYLSSPASFTGEVVFN
jgi:hypothetical protein